MSKTIDGEKGGFNREQPNTFYAAPVDEHGYPKWRNIAIEDVKPIANEIGSNFTVPYTTTLNNITKNAADINVLTTDFLTLADKVEENIDLNLDGFASLQSTVNNHTTSINSLVTQTNLSLDYINENTTSINTLTGITGSHTSSIATLNDNVGNNTSSIGTLNTTTSGHTTSITELNSITEENTEDIAANTANISTNTSSINTLNSTTAGHTTNLNNLNSTTSTNTTNISNNTSSINTLNTTVGNHTTSIGNNTTAIITNANAITNANSNITTNTNSINTLNTNVGNHATSIGSLNSTVSGHTTSINSLNSTTSSNTSNIATNTANISTANSNITTNTNSITNLNSIVSGHTTNIVSLNDTTTAHTTNISNNTASIGTLNTTVGNHNTSINTANANIATNASNITSANGNIATNTSNIATLTTSLETTNSNVTNLTTQVNTVSGTGPYLKQTSATLISPTIQTPTFSAALSVANGGTGVTTSTGTGNNVLSASPALTGTTTINGGAGYALDMTVARNDNALFVKNTNSGGWASIRYSNNNTSNDLFIGLGGSTTPNEANQAYIRTTGLNGLQIFGTLKLNTTLATIYGGTGTTTSTGTGSNVLNASPTFTGTVNAATLALTTALPVTSGGTGLTSTSQNFAFLGPLSGSGPPVWRAITSADIPAAGTPTFSDLTPNGVMYASSSSLLASTTAGIQYQSLIANATGAPSFQALNLSQADAVTGTLPVTLGGTGVTTSTGTGSNVLSDSPTFTGSISVGAATLTTPLALTSGGTGTTTATGTGSVVLSASPTFTGIVNAEALALTTALPVLSGGTGVTTSTGTGSNVLSASPTLTGTTTINAGAGYALDMTVARNDNALIIKNTNSGGWATIRYSNNNQSNDLFIGLGGSTTTNEANQAYIRTTGSNGLQIFGTLKLNTTLATIYGGTGTTTSTGTGSNVLSASPTLTGTTTMNGGANFATSISAARNGDTVFIKNTNTGGYGSIEFQNDATAHKLYIGVGGGTTPAATANQCYIKAVGGNGLSLQGPVKLDTTLDTIYGGTGTTTSTGTGSNVLSASPTFTGTVTAAAVALTAPLPVASGGTGTTYSIGTGAAVLNTNPVFNGTITAGMINATTVNAEIIQVSGLHTTYRGFHIQTYTTGGSALYGYFSLATGDGVVATQYLNNTPTVIATNTTNRYITVPSQGLYQFSFTYSKKPEDTAEIGGLEFFIVRNGGNNNDLNFTNDQLIATSTAHQNTITGISFMSITDKVYVGVYAHGGNVYSGSSRNIFTVTRLQNRG